jgi:hypothetical protein
VAAPLDQVIKGFQYVISELQDCNSASQRRRAKAYGESPRGLVARKVPHSVQRADGSIARIVPAPQGEVCATVRLVRRKPRPEAPVAISLPAISHVAGRRY